MYKYTEHQKYKVFNFHSIKTIETLKSWLHADTSKLMVLTGEDRIGKTYILEAACFEETENGLPYVVEIDNGILG